MTNRSSLFTIDLRIDKKIAKLQVYEEDNLSDLIQRLFKLVTWKRMTKEKIKNRLQEQFRKLVSGQNISSNIKNKLNDLLDESKFVVVGLQSAKNIKIVTFNETPFKILQDSLRSKQKHASELKDQRHYHYLDQLTPNLHMNYDASERSQQEQTRSSHRQGQFENIIIDHRRESPQKYSYMFEVKNDSSIENEAVLRKYQALDRKCQDYIKRNIGISDNLKVGYDRIQLNNLQREAEEQRSRSRERLSVSPVNLRKSHQYEPKSRFKEIQVDRQLHQNRMEHNQNIFKGKVENVLKPQYSAKPDQTFQEYKINRIKSTKGFTHQNVLLDQRRKLSSNREDLLHPKGFKSQDYKKQSILYDLGHVYPGFTAHRDGRKFNYLCQA